MRKFTVSHNTRQGCRLSENFDDISLTSQWESRDLDSSLSATTNSEALGEVLYLRGLSAPSGLRMGVSQRSFPLSIYDSMLAAPQVISNTLCKPINRQKQGCPRICCCLPPPKYTQKRPPLQDKACRPGL